MTEETRKTALDLAWLAACAVEGKTPDAQRVAGLDLPALYRMAERHLMTGVTAMALERAGVRDEAFTQAKGKAIRKAAAFDVERAAVLDALEDAGIWYLPMKGCVLQELYPRLGMRQMSDNDILIDAARSADVERIMERLGFSREDGNSYREHYFKQPVCNFELHRALFGESGTEIMRSYFAETARRMLPDAGRRYAYHLSDEDFYIYLLAHEYKHYSGSGTGLRSLLDVWVFLRHKGETLDRAYIAGELDKLELTAFEAANRSLALHLFGGEPLTAADAEMLDYMLSSGVYGTLRNRVRNQVARKGLFGFLLSRAFPPRSVMRVRYPILADRPILLPVCWLLRLAQALVKKPKKVLAQLRAAFR